MSYDLSFDQADQIIRELEKDYRVFAPRRLAGRGWKPGTDLVRYAQISSVSEIVRDMQSSYSPKDVFYPIIQTVLHFTAEECHESAVDDKGIILFARPCDINGIKRLDTIFLKNGGQEDLYYRRLREKLKIIMLECREGWENCFCVSMGANLTDQYDMAVRFTGQGLLAEVKNAAFAGLFAGLPETEFTPEFVQANLRQVRLPVINGSEQLKKAYGLPLWETFNDKCVSCGSCNTVCITCSCFDTTDIIYHETSRDGERRRVWSSCMLENFSTMAGGHGVRKTAGERMRFKTLHKVHDYRARFGGADNMCVGCGRCDSRCPEKISFSDTINSLSHAMASSEVIQNG